MSGWMVRPGVILMVIASQCVGCGTAERATPVATRRDSLGVAIVEHARGSLVFNARDVPHAIRIDTIGRIEGPPEYLFGRLVGFAPLSTGRVIVADGMGPWIRLYDATGKHLETVGRPGEGPGEYRYLQGLHQYRGDSLIVVDFEGGRWSVLDPGGNVARSWYPQQHGLGVRGDSPRLLGTFGDGSLLLGESRRGGRVPLSADGGVVLEEDSVRFFRASWSGEVLADFGTKVGSRWVTGTLADGRPFTWDGMQAGIFWAASGDRFYYADAKRLEIQVFSSAGPLEVIIRAAGDPGPPPRISRSALARQPDVFLQMYQLTRLPEEAPSFSELAVDADGGVWILEYQNEYETPRSGVAQWMVFGAGGQLQGGAVLPSSFRQRRTPFASGGTRLVFGNGYVLSALSNEMGVQTVGRYRLGKQEGRQTVED